MTTFPPHDLGLALSGGGSRAAAFHLGTVQGLEELGLIDRVDVVSTVSGGSVFGGAWAAARADGRSHREFLATMREELSKGFIARSIRPLGLLKALLPGIDYSRTHLIADTFDRVFFHGKTLGSLPERPALCINTALLNNGQVGKFSKAGFSAWGLKVPGSELSHLAPWPDFPLALAVAASAAFPIGLPPLQLRRNRFPKGTAFTEGLQGAERIALTDGGVLENLGIQTLLRSDRFAAWNLIVSDAGTRDTPWSPKPVIAAARGFAVWVASGRILDRLMIVMNDKQNRWARQQVVEEVERSWLVDAAGGQASSPGLTALLSTKTARPRRNLIFARVAQDWASFMRSISHYRLVEIAVARGGQPTDAPKAEDLETRQR